MATQGPKGRADDLSCAIAAVDAFHVVATGQSYWRGQKATNRRQSDRFVLKPGWRTVYAQRVETALVRVTLADGTVGWGEATEPICPEIVCRLVSGLVAPMLGGRTFENPHALWEAGYDLNRGRGHAAGYQLLALAALDMAIWDALGHRAGLPVAALLSEAPARSIPLYLSGLRRATLAERIDLLAEVIGRGFAGAKVFVDGDTQATLAEMSALREGVPGDWRLMVDALWSYETASSAAEARRNLARHDVSWLECPLPPEDLAAHRELATADGVRIALGEHFFTAWQCGPWLEPGTIDVFQPDLGRTGFSDGWHQLMQARRSGIGVTPHMGSGSPVVQAACLQFAAAVNGAEPCEYQRDLSGAFADAVSTAWIERDGRMALPDAPGLGLTVSAEAVAHSAATVESWRPD